MSTDPLSVVNLIAQTIFDKKGMNILALDIKEISTLTDFVIIAEGGVDRHVVAIANAIMERLKEIGYKPVNVEGMQTGDWVVAEKGKTPLRNK